PVRARSPSARQRLELLLVLGDRWVGQGGAVWEPDRGDGLVAAVHAHDVLGRGGVLLDVDLAKLDAFAGELRLQSVAVTTPRGGVEREHEHPPGGKVSAHRLANARSPLTAMI